jgi:hypothetical protein
MDMDMSMEGSTTSYADYEHQHLNFIRQFGGLDNSANSLVQSRVEPLENRGGLENDEVAEMVALRAYTSLGVERADNRSNTEPGRGNVRGVLGANLDEFDQLDEGENQAGTHTFLEDVEGNFSDSGASNVDAASTDAPGIFYHHADGFSPGFNDTAAGSGGGAGYSLMEAELINFRDLYGRGPILDASDEIVAITRLINEQNDFDWEFNLRASVVWDVSTIEDERKEFALP